MVVKAAIVIRVLSVISALSVVSVEACQSSLIEALGVGLGLQTGRPRRAGGHLPDHPPALLHRHRQPSRSLLSWTVRVDGTRTTCRGPATCRQRSMIAIVRVLTGSPLSSCAPSVGAGGLTLTIVRGPVKSTVRSASEGIYRPIWPLRRVRWRLKCAFRSSRTSGHRRVLSRRACGPMDRHAVIVCHDGERRGRRVDRRLRARAARPALPGKTGLDMLGAIRADEGTGQ